MSWGALDVDLLGPALCAGLLVLATHVPLGRQVLARGIVFIDLAIAQVAGLGVIAANMLGWEAQGWAVQIAAGGGALLAALLLAYTERRWPRVQEALIGALFVLAASAAMLLLARHPHGGEHLKDLLVGQILWVNYAQLLPVAVLTPIILALWWRLGRRAGYWLFYTLFALAVTASVQLVGVYLVFASLIIPALVAARGGLAAGYAVGALGYALGLAASAWWDLPAGALIVWAMAGAGAALYGRCARRVTDN